MRKSVNLLLIIGFFPFFIFVHELSHFLVGILSGNEFLGFVLTPTNNNTFFSFGIGVKFNHINYNYYLVEIIAGSLGSALVSLPIIFFAIKKRNMIIFSISPMVLLSESMYWSLGSLLNGGDPSNLFWYFKNKINVSYNPFNFFLGFLILSFFIYGLFIITLIKVWRLREIDIYGK